MKATQDQIKKMKNKNEKGPKPLLERASMSNGDADANAEVFPLHETMNSPCTLYLSSRKYNTWDATPGSDDNRNPKQPADVYH